jgi:hypothetical protein
MLRNSLQPKMLLSATEAPIIKLIMAVINSVA